MAAVSLLPGFDKALGAPENPLRQQCNELFSTFAGETADGRQVREELKQPLVVNAGKGVVRAFFKLPHGADVREVAGRVEELSPKEIESLVGAMRQELESLDLRFLGPFRHFASKVRRRVGLSLATLQAGHDWLEVHDQDVLAWRANTAISLVVLTLLLRGELEG